MKLSFVIAALVGLVTAQGEDWASDETTTVSGLECQAWTSQTPQAHDRTSTNYPNSGLGDHNFCRNPDDSAGPWCYTMDPSVRWEYCSEEQTTANTNDTEECTNDESATNLHGATCSQYYDQGMEDYCGDYDTDDFVAAEMCCLCGGGIYGDMTTTMEEEWDMEEECVNDDSVRDGSIYGYTCSELYNTAITGPTAEKTNYCGDYDTDDFVAAEMCCLCGGGSSYYSDESSDEPLWWQYIVSDTAEGYGMIMTEDMVSYTIWDSSDSTCVASLEWEDETDTSQGAWGKGYRGSASTTGSGLECQAWTSQTPHAHSYTPTTYPNSGLGDQNFCRNPSEGEGPWCYTTDPSVRWAYCSQIVYVTDLDGQCAYDDYYLELNWPEGDEQPTGFKNYTEEGVEAIGLQGNAWNFTQDEDVFTYYVAMDYDYDFDMTEECANDDSVGDSGGDTCSAYYTEGMEGSCGSYDTDDFVAAEMCCICLGRSSNGYDNNYDYDFNMTEECVNDDSLGDSGGDTCSAYYVEGMEGSCGSYDDDYFIAAERCCICGGGSSYDLDYDYGYDEYDYGYDSYDYSYYSGYDSYDSYDYYGYDTYYYTDYGYDYSDYGYGYDDYSYDYDSYYGYDSYGEYYYGYDDSLMYGEDYGYEVEETFTSEARGMVFDYFWYAMDSNDESSDLMNNSTCNTTLDCDGNGVTMCCVSIISTSPNGAVDNMFRCMNRGVVEMSWEQTFETDSGEEMMVNMKCLGDAAHYIKAGIATAFVLFASLY